MTSQYIELKNYNWHLLTAVKSLLMPILTNIHCVLNGPSTFSFFFGCASSIIFIFLSQDKCWFIIYYNHYFLGSFWWPDTSLLIRSTRKGEQTFSIYAFQFQVGVKVYGVQSCTNRSRKYAHLRVPLSSAKGHPYLPQRAPTYPTYLEGAPTYLRAPYEPELQTNFPHTVLFAATNNHIMFPKEHLRTFFHCWALSSKSSQINPNWILIPTKQFISRRKIMLTVCNLILHRNCLWIFSSRYKHIDKVSENHVCLRLSMPLNNVHVCVTYNLFSLIYPLEITRFFLFSCAVSNDFFLKFFERETWLKNVNVKRQFFIRVKNSCSLI